MIKSVVAIKSAAMELRARANDAVISPPTLP